MGKEIGFCYYRSAFWDANEIGHSGNRFRERNWLLKTRARLGLVYPRIGAVLMRSCWNFAAAGAVAIVVHLGIVDAAMAISFGAVDPKKIGARNRLLQSRKLLWLGWCCVIDIGAGAAEVRRHFRRIGGWCSCCCDVFWRYVFVMPWSHDPDM